MILILKNASEGLGNTIFSEWIPNIANIWFHPPYHYGLTLEKRQITGYL